MTSVLQGTLALGSCVRETEASLGGGYLPWINNFRREGGTVAISQSEGWASLGARFAVAANVAIDAALRYVTIGQHEKSTEDGNDFQMSATTVALALIGKF